VTPNQARGDRRTSHWRTQPPSGRVSVARFAGELVFVTVTAQGSPSTRFARAVERGSLRLAELAAREMSALPLEDALSLVTLYAAEQDSKYERAAARLLARIGNERPELRLTELQVAAAVLADLPNDPRRSEFLSNLLRSRGASAGIPKRTPKRAGHTAAGRGQDR